MSTIVAEEARRQLAAFAEGEASLTNLYNWLVDHVVAVEDAKRDPDVRAVIGNTVLLLSEYRAGHRTKPEIRQYVAGLLATGAPEPADRATRV